jgi:putative endopeptidase
MSAGKCAPCFARQLHLYAALWWMRRIGVRALDASPIAADLAAIRGVKTKSDLAVLMGRTKRGFGASLFFVGIGPDAKDPNRNTLSASQGGLGLPDRDYYLRDSFKG